MTANMKSLIRQYALLVVAGIIMASGLATVIISTVNSIHERVYLGAVTEIDLGPGNYALFYEYEVSKQQYGPVKITRSEKPADAPLYASIGVTNSKHDIVPIVANTSLSYTSNNRKGESFASFQINRSDHYTIDMGTQSQAYYPAELTLAADFSKKLLASLKTFGIFALAAVPFALAGFFMYRAADKKRSSRIAQNE